MEFNKSLHTVDSHTMGEPTRIVVGGLPPIPGETMAEKKKYLEEEMDDLRTSLMHEPRGHSDMFGAVIVSPTKKEADLGVIFMDGGGYLNMCGHGSIGTATVAVETGLVNAEEPYTNLKMEAPAGIIETEVKVKDGKAKEVTMTNVPSFLYKEDVKVNVPSIGEVNVDISFGGSFFGLVNADELDVEIIPENSDKLLNMGLKIREVLNQELEIQHPEKEHINTVDLIEFYSHNTFNIEADKKNAVVFGQGQLDRSPCGTGTSAKLATLYARNKIGLNEEFVYESILGTLFRGKIVDKVPVNGFEAIVPQVTGSAYITGFNNFVVDPDDSLKHGFCLA